ncbi:MAG: hypothetical protein KBC60_10190 [Haliscomenobacter sp.]|nr:hypothetical protein [Haliscomenobacter sp.]
MRQMKTYTPLWAFFVLVLFLSNCSSPVKVMETGDYDEAIGMAIQRLAGKKEKKEDLVRTLEDAFEKATARDMEMADRLKASGRPEDWERVYEVYQRIEARQARIEPLLPLYDRVGNQANFRFVRTDGLKKEAQEEAAAFLYKDALRLMDNARRNRDRLAAREAVGQLQRIDKYFRIYRDRDALLEEARELGTTFVLVHMENRAPVVLPSGLEQEIMQLGFGNQQGSWKVFHSERQSGVEYDYRVTYSLLDVQASPGVVKEREYEETKEIEDGFQYVLDERGNVKKDSLGNDVKVPKKVVIKAWVLENYQHKMVRMAGRLEFFDYRTGTLIDVQDLGAEAFFENYASTFKGDERALSADTRKRIGNRPMPFPTDEILLLDAGRKLKPLIREKLERTKLLL